MTGNSKSIWAATIALAVALTSEFQAMAALVQFEIESGGSPRLITLESVMKDEVPYVPLQGLVEQAGGSYNLLPTRLRVDLGGSTAWLRTGESRVHAMSIFSLMRPILDNESNALIAVDDVPGFFLKSFRITVRPFGGQSTPVTPSATMTPSEPRVSTPAPADAPAEPAALEQLGAPTSQPGVVTAILIDAGHGGYDAGLQSNDKKTEDEIALGIATRVKKLLESAGAPMAILTRSEDVETRPEQRLRLAEASPGSIFISIHTGSSLSPAAEGVAIFYSTPDAPAGATSSRADARLAAESRRLAESIGPATATSAGAALRGIVQAPLRLLGELQVPAVEIEVGCLTSSADSQRLATDEYLAQLAAGIFNGITVYLAGGTAATSSAAATTTPEAN